jgi:hypothetical protein
MFAFTITANEYFREGFLEIRMRYKFDDNSEWTILTEIVPRERFYKDKDFAQRVVDNLFDKSRQEVTYKLKEMTDNAHT